MWIHPTLQGDVPIRYGEMLASLKAEWWDNGMSPAIAAAQEGGYAIRVHRLTDVPFQRTDKESGEVGEERLVISVLEAAAASTPKSKALSKFIDPNDIENASGVRIGSKYAYIHAINAKKAKILVTDFGSMGDKIVVVDGIRFHLSIDLVRKAKAKGNTATKEALDLVLNTGLDLINRFQGLDDLLHLLVIHHLIYDLTDGFSIRILRHGHHHRH